MKILVTGGNGLTGRYIVNRLAREHQVEVFDHRVIDRSNIPTHKGDVLDIQALKTCARDVEAVVHLAAIPHPLDDPPERVFTTNTVGTFNVLEASASNGVGRVVFMSSESALGFAFSNGKVTPEYLPVDELHVLRPVDPYALSKSAGESLCESYSRRGAMTTICLRPPWIWVPEEGELRRYRELVNQFALWPQTLWAYVHVLDVAEAVAAAVSKPIPSHHDVCFICAAENWTGKDSRELIQRFFPLARLVDPERAGPYSLISWKQAEKLLGYRPRYSLRDILEVPRQ
jgi:nucleoside-diphosphate-sugar epimerase